MTKCLVTTLKGVVNDNSLPYFGEFYLGVSDSGRTGVVKNSVGVTFAKPFRCFATGGNFLSEAGDSLGNILSFSAGNQVIRFDDKVEEIRFSGMYSCTALNCGEFAYKLRSVDVTVEKLQNQINIETLQFSSSRGLSFSGSFTELSKRHQNVKSLAVWDRTSNPFTLAELASFANLESLTVNSGAVSGDISDLAKLASLKTLMLGYQGTDPSASAYKITGDLAKLPLNLQTFNWSESNYALSWKSQRSTDTWPIAMTRVRVGSDLDALLINQAACTKESPLGTAEKIMSFIGTRTSASDAAVAALQAKGWTITVTEA